MKSRLTILLTISMITTSFAQNKDAEILKKLNRDWISSYVTRDTATMSRIFADDLVLVSPNRKNISQKGYPQKYNVAGAGIYFGKSGYRKR